VVKDSRHSLQCLTLSRAAGRVAVNYGGTARPPWLRPAADESWQPERGDACGEQCWRSSSWGWRSG
jgi:hypothetical protein